MSRFILCCFLFVLPIAASGPLSAQIAGGGSSALPRVVIPTTGRPQPPPLPRPANPAERMTYPWRTNITATIFWIGEQPTPRNPTPNCKSSWDTKWAINFGGYDDPNPENRIANHVTGEFRPKAFVPKLNPFYVALPYNDVLSHRAHKPEAPSVIPWFSRMNPAPGKTVCKGRWLQIYNGKRICYAQWEDCGPWTTTDWEYVFGGERPKNTQNKAAGIDLSPAVRDFLGLRSGHQVHWRFVDDADVPDGPWKRYGFDAEAETNLARVVAANDPELEAQRRYMEYLRKLRDEEYQKKPLR
jgi:hypothetical protein